MVIILNTILIGLFKLHIRVEFRCSMNSVLLWLKALNQVLKNKSINKMIPHFTL